jgi:hypothetical protein
MHHSLREECEMVGRNIRGLRYETVRAVTKRERANPRKIFVDGSVASAPVLRISVVVTLHLQRRRLCHVSPFPDTI